MNLIWTNIRKVAVGTILARPEAFIIAVGVLLRLKHLLENRPFWLDEACAAVSITSRTNLEILTSHEIMPDIVHSPMVFAMIEKFFVSVLGNNEFALRFFPFLCGVGALLLFARVTVQMLSRRAFLIGLTVFALAEPLVYYSAELKQYSTDLLCAIGLIGLTRLVLAGNFRTRDCLLLAVSGAVVLWLSNAMIFVLAGIGLVLLLNKPWQSGWRKVVLLGLTALMWLASFIFLYTISLKYLAGNKATLSAWKGAFSTHPLLSVGTLLWAWDAIVASFTNPVGLKWWWLTFPCFVYGAALLWRKDKNLMLLWLLPVLVTLLAAVFGKYPFYGRVILFLIAGYYVFIACAVDDVLNKIGSFGRQWVWVALVIFLLQPVADASYYLGHSRTKTDNRAAMAFLAKNYQPGDFIYLSTSAQPPFWYYAGQTGLSRIFPQPVVGFTNEGLIRGFKMAKFALDPGEIQGRQFVFFRNEYNIFDEKGMFRANMSSPKDRKVAYVPLGLAFSYPPTGRTWLFVSSPDALEAGSNAQILGSFDRSAQRLMFYEGLNAGVYLYDIK